MNLILRLIRVVVSALLGRRRGLLDESVVTFRVWPNDLDLNLHMNNGRYLTVMDLGRSDLMIRAGLARLVVRRGWMPVLGSATVRFRRSLAPFERYVLRTRLLCWDDKWMFIEHRFETRGGRLACHAVVKGTFRTAGVTVSPAEVLDALGCAVSSPPAPAAVIAWTDSERDMRDLAA